MMMCLSVLWYLIVRSIYRCVMLAYLRIPPTPTHHHTTHQALVDQHGARLSLTQTSSEALEEERTTAPAQDRIRVSE